MRKSILTGCLLILFAVTDSVAETAPTVPDGIAREAAYPEFVQIRKSSGKFESLHAESLVGRLKLLVKPEVSTNALVTAFVSIEEPGHWRSRDWRPFPMDRSGDQWDATVPFRNLDLPVYYFLQTIDRAETNLSPIRVCFPRELGLENVTSVFFPFIEGFEIGSTGWRRILEDHYSDSVELSPSPKNGYYSLLTKIPDGRRSATVGTFRVRGSEILTYRTLGLRFWARSDAGSVKVRCTLFANAFTTNQVISVFPVDSTISDKWEKVQLPFQRFPKLPLSEVDFFTIEFIASGPRSVWIDDLEYLGLGNL